MYKQKYNNLLQKMDSTSIIQFWLSENKLIEMTKLMLNKKSSIKALNQYQGDTQKSKHHQQLQHFCENTILQNITYFTIEDLIKAKGSTRSKPKYCENTLLNVMITQKLTSGEEPDHLTRLQLWVSFTDFYVMEDLYSGLHHLDCRIQIQDLIKKDIIRTQTTQDIKKQATEVLTQFSKYNPFIGYCQGMNYIVTFILQNGIAKEKAFFILKRITECILPTDYYTTMDTPPVDIQILYYLIFQMNPKLYAKLEKIRQESDYSSMVVLSFAFQWFVCLFTNKDLTMVIRRAIWDRFLVQGDITLFKAALVILEFLTPFILQSQTFQEYLKVVQIQIPKIIEVKYFIDKYNQIYINPQIMNLMRSKLTSLRNQSQKIKQNSNSHQINSIHSELFIFRRNQNIKLIPDYLQTISHTYFHQTKKYPDPTDRLMIGRAHKKIILQNEKMVIGNDLPIKHTFKQQISQTTGSERASVIKTLTNIQQRKREKLVEILQKMYGNNGMIRSDSMVFMKDMVQNVNCKSLQFLEDLIHKEYY